ARSPYPTLRSSDLIVRLLRWPVCAHQHHAAQSHLHGERPRPAGIDLVCRRRVRRTHTKYLPAQRDRSAAMTDPCLPPPLGHAAHECSLAVLLRRSWKLPATLAYQFAAGLVLVSPNPRWKRWYDPPNGVPVVLTRVQRCLILWHTRWSISASVCC